MILVVDLAPKMSAACVMSVDGRVHHEFDSYGKSAFQFVKEMREAADEYKVSRVVIEDAPYGIRQSMVKSVLRLHGVIMALLHPYIDHMFFVNPSTWQKTYVGVSRGTEKDRIESARAAAHDLGYDPPPLVETYVQSLGEGERVLKKHTDPLAKVMTDYVDAFLIGRWVLTFTEQEFSRLVGVQLAFI